MNCYLKTDDIVLKVILVFESMIYYNNTKLWSEEVVILFHHVVLYFHLVFIRIVGLFFLFLLWFRNHRLRIWSLFVLIWKQVCKKALLLLFFLLLDVHTLLVNWFFHLHHRFRFHFMSLLYFVWNSLIHSCIFRVKMCLLLLVLWFLEIFIHILCPSIVIWTWSFNLSSRIQCSSIWCYSLMYYINIGFLLHNFSLSSCLRFRADNSQKFATFRTCVDNLSLERDFLQILQGNLQKFEIFFLSQLILKGNFSFNSCICKRLY